MQNEQKVEREHSSQELDASREYEVRVEKVKAMRAQGIEPWPTFKEVSATCQEALDKFEKVRHKIRMTSLNDVFSEEELYDWEKRIKKLLFF